MSAAAKPKSAKPGGRAAVPAAEPNAATLVSARGRAVANPPPAALCVLTTDPACTSSCHLTCQRSVPSRSHGVQPCLQSAQPRAPSTSAPSRTPSSSCTCCHTSASAIWQPSWTQQTFYVLSWLPLQQRARCMQPWARKPGQSHTAAALLCLTCPQSLPDNELAATHAVSPSNWRQSCCSGSSTKMSRWRGGLSWSGGETSWRGWMQKPRYAGLLECQQQQ